jgi:hypothetical protein
LEHGQRTICLPSNELYESLFNNVDGFNWLSDPEQERAFRDSLSPASEWKQ